MVKGKYSFIDRLFDLFAEIYGESDYILVVN